MMLLGLALAALLACPVAPPATRIEALLGAEGAVVETHQEAAASLYDGKGSTMTLARVTVRMGTDLASGVVVRINDPGHSVELTAYVDADELPAAAAALRQMETVAKGWADAPPKAGTMAEHSFRTKGAFSFGILSGPDRPSMWARTGPGPWARFSYQCQALADILRAIEAR